MRVDEQTRKFVEILNRLKRGAVEGKVLWEHTGIGAKQYRAPLDQGFHAVVAEAPSGASVIFTMTNGQGLQTIYLDSALLSDDLLRLALFQLYTTVRNTLSDRIAGEALDALKGL